MFKPDQTFKNVLKEEFEERCKRNPSYSLRAFARDLAISPSRLSEIFSNKKGLSARNALKISKKLGFTKDEIEVFTALVDSEHGRGKAAKERARVKLNAIKNQPGYQLIQLDTFKVISDWYHYAILELTYVKDFKSDVEWIAKRLGISATAAELAIKRLKQLDLLEEMDHRLRATDQFSASPSGIPSDALKKHHEQIVDKAKAAVYGQSIDERDLSALTLAIDSRKIPEAKALIKKFRHDFNRIMSEVPETDRVYCLAIQFFGLDQLTPQKMEK